jgi:general secretion pathway protein D
MKAMKFCAYAAMALCLFPVACTTTGQPEAVPSTGTALPQAIKPPVPVPLRAEAAKAAVVSEPAVPASAAGPHVPAPTLFRGKGSLVGEGRKSTARFDRAGDITLDFVNADVRDVVKSVLGDLLKLNYTIDPAVQGTVTLETNRPIGRSAVLPALENALRLAGVAVIEASGEYRVVPIGNAARSGAASGPAAAATPGFGIRIVPLRYVSAADMQRALEPLIPQGGILRIDAARNLLVIAGTEAELSNMLDDIATFDVDYLAGLSFGLFPLKNVNAKTIVGELNHILGEENSPVAGLVRLIPIERLNAVLASSIQPRYLDRVEEWIERLDRDGVSSEQQIFVYHVQHGRAADLANVLTKVLHGGEAGASASRGGTGAAGSGRMPGGEKPAEAAAPATAGTAPASASPNPAGDEGVGAQPAGGIGEASLRITADEINNSLLILATQQQYRIIEATLKKLDILPLQVLIEASIAEVTLTDDLQYGMQYYFKTHNNQFTLSTAASGTVGAIFPGFNYIYSSGQNIEVVLQLLKTLTTVRVLSSPTLMVRNNETARLQVGDQVPIATQSAVSTQTTGAPVVNTIEYHDTGIILQVTPRVNAGGLVLLDISQEVSEVAQTTSSSIDSPTIQQRKVTSSVAVSDGDTIALAGLISDSRTDTGSGIPFLKDIPVLGILFGTTDHSVSRTELVALITPHVVASRQAAMDLTEELKRKLPLVAPPAGRPTGGPVAR